jgi:cholesterol oxidase
MGRVTVPVGGTRPTDTASTGLAFTETMKGFFVDGSSAPADAAAYVDCEKRGQRLGRRIDFTLTITMPDLDLFLGERSHTAAAVGTVHADHITRADGASVTTGVFNLFVEGASSSERRMLYSLPFVGADGRKYLLDGYKEVKDHGHFDVWGATSTLYTVIRKGTTHADPVCAAGVLHILIPDFLHQLTTFRVLGARTETERVAAIARFGRAFAGSLWEVFVAPKL